MLLGQFGSGDILGGSKRLALQVIYLFKSLPPWHRAHRLGRSLLTHGSAVVNGLRGADTAATVEAYRAAVVAQDELNAACGCLEMLGEERPAPEHLDAINAGIADLRKCLRQLVNEAATPPRLDPT